VAPDYPSVAFNTNVFGFIGGNVQFHAEFNLGSMPITNQWVLKLDSGGGYTPIAGATGWYWTVTNVQSSKAGNYELTATNAVGSSNSSAAHLTALADPPPPSSNGVTNMYANCVMTNHPWAYWKFEETNDTFFSSMQAYDYSTHNFDAIYGNSTDGTTATGCKDGGESLPDVGPGGSDKYAGFPLNNMCAKMSANHANGYLLVPPLNLYTNTVTFTMWIKPKLAAFPKSTGLFMNRNGGDAAGIGFGTATNALGMPCLAYTWNTNSSATYGWNSGLFPVTNIWNFVACTITPSNTTMYLYYASSDGTNLYKAVNSVANGPEAFSGGTTWLGSDNWNNGYNFNGWIDEVAVFTNSLGENQITDLFLKALALQLWPFPPVFYLQPSNTAVFQGQTLQLTALASGIPIPTYYQWQFSNSTWLNLASTTGRIASNSTLTWQNFTGAFSNFRCIATNYGGRATSSVATVTVLPAPPLPPTNGLWTVNFAITPPNSTPYHGRGVLGTNMYWNALSGTFIDLVGPQFTNVPPSLLDDGATVSGINFGSFPIYLGWSGSVGTNNVLLDTFCSFVEGAAFIFTSVPNGIYKLALYGIDGASAGLGTIFTVNGVSQSVINAQDITFLPDNTVVYTNVMVTNGILEVTMVSIPRGACPMWGCSGAFNGAQLQLITYYGPNILSLTNSGKNMVLTYVGGQLLEATNMSGPWTTNLTATSPFTISPTGQMKFYRVYTNNIPQ
jgi:hypothetical protein